MSDAVYWSEMKDLRDFRKEYPEFPSVAFDTAEFRMSQYRSSSLRITAASSGLIVLTGIVAGLAIWILQKTIGETLKDAWLETEFHRKLKVFYSTDILKK